MGVLGREHTSVPVAQGSHDEEADGLIGSLLQHGGREALVRPLQPWGKQARPSHRRPPRQTQERQGRKRRWRPWAAWPRSLTPPEGKAERLTLFPHDLPDPVEESSVFGAGRGLVMDKFHLRKRRQGAGFQGSGRGRTWPPYEGASAVMFTSFSNNLGSRHVLPCFVLSFFKAVLSSHCLEDRVLPPGGSSGGLSAPGSPGRLLPTSTVSAGHNATTPPPQCCLAPCLLRGPAHLDGLHGAHDHHGLGHSGAQAAQQPARAVQPSLGVPHVVAEKFERPEPGAGG